MQFSESKQKEKEKFLFKNVHKKIIFNALTIRETNTYKSTLLLYPTNPYTYICVHTYIDSQVVGKFKKYLQNTNVFLHSLFMVVQIVL